MKAEKITVHTVLVGNTAGRGAPVPQFDAAGRPEGFKTDEGGAPVLSRPDPALLRRLAAATGGTFSIVAPGKTDLDGVARAIDLAARNPLSETVATNLEERFQIPLAVAVAAAALLLVGPLRRPRPGGSLALAAFATVAAVATLAAPAARASQPAPAPPAGPAGTPPQAGPPSGPPRPSTLAQRILSRPPFTSPRAEALAGRKALAEKKEAEALSRFGQQAALDPGDPAGPYNVGTALARTGQAQEAAAALDAARRGPDRGVAADAAYETGLVLYRGGRYGEAAGAFRDALRLAPGAADAAYNYELSLRRAEEQKQKQQQQKPQQQQQKQQQEKKSPEQQKKEAQEKADREFEQKAKMTRDKAEQLLSAIARADLDEQKKKIAEQKKPPPPGEGLVRRLLFAALGAAAASRRSARASSAAALCALLVPLLPALPLAAQGNASGPAVEVHVDRPRPAADDLVRLTYVFTGPGAGGSLRAPAQLPLKNLRVVGGPNTSTQISFINGEVSRSSSLTYFLKPLGPGAAEVGESAWKVGDHDVKAPAYALDVGPPRRAAGAASAGPGGEDAGEADDPFAAFFGGALRPGPRPRGPTRSSSTPPPPTS